MIDLATLVLALIASVVVWGGIGGMLGGRLKDRALDGFIWGALLGPFGLLLTLAMASHFAKCPECLAEVPREARRCRHCGTALTPAVAAGASPMRPGRKQPRGWKTANRLSSEPAEPANEVPDERVLDWLNDADK